MTIKIKKPKNGKEFVNLYATVSEVIQEIDKNFPEYFLESNIMDDCEFEAIIEMFKEYYKEVRNAKLEVINDTEDIWIISILPK